VLCTSIMERVRELLGYQQMITQIAKYEDHRFIINGVTLQLIVDNQGPSVCT